MNGDCSVRVIGVARDMKVPASLAAVVRDIGDEVGPDGDPIVRATTWWPPIAFMARARKRREAIAAS
jgi:hypothetical protein